MIYDRTQTRQLSQLGGLLKVMPFISTVFVIAGLCSLGLPGFSGFVAEVTVFMGSWQNADNFYRIATIIACASIVVTSVYILRAVGKAIMGPLQLTDNSSPLLWRGARGEVDAKWNEKWAAALLIIGIVAIGIAPFWLNHLVGTSAETLMKNIGRIVMLK
jgi:NADH-quinone oxidoreductase subunit M